MTAPHPPHVPTSTLFQWSYPSSKSVRLEKVFMVASAVNAENLAIASNQRDKVLAACSHNLPQNIIAGRSLAACCVRCAWPAPLTHLCFMWSVEPGLGCSDRRLPPISEWHERASHHFRQNSTPPVLRSSSQPHHCAAQTLLSSSSGHRSMSAVWCWLWLVCGRLSVDLFSAAKGAGRNPLLPLPHLPRRSGTHLLCMHYYGCKHCPPSQLCPAPCRCIVHCVWVWVCV
jgi:hypothetical protein